MTPITDRMTALAAEYHGRAMPQEWCAEVNLCLQEAAALVAALTPPAVPAAVTDDDAQLVRDILEEYADDMSKEACDECEGCGEIFMCSFHSVLSALSRRTWTTGAIRRADRDRPRSG